MGADGLSPLMDRHDLYERCVQSPDRDARMLRAIHGLDPVILGEDFAGGGAVSRAWVALGAGSSAVAVDHDEAVLSRASGVDRLTTVASDVMRAGEPCDVLFVGNFSICELHTRARLVEYLRHARSRLRARGVLACDIYGGSDAYELGEIETKHKDGSTRGLTHTWEQRHADPLTGRVVNAIHFRWKDDRGRSQEMRDAFIYNWRLWTIPELREAMEEAGFARTQVFHRTERAEDTDGTVYVHPIDDPLMLDDPHFVFVVGRD